MAQKKDRELYPEEANARDLRACRRLLRALHPHVMALSVTDEAPEFKRLLARVEKLM